MFERLIEKGFEVQFHSHAKAILQLDFPQAVAELETVLADIDVPITEIIGSGGGEAHGTQRLRRALAERGWRKVCFELRKTINGVERESISHEVDHVRSFPDNQLVALEIEWNNKDPFFDRDLENFKRLHAEGAISVGVIITRGSTLQNQLRSLVLRFAEERGIDGFDALVSLGLEPTRRQRQAVTTRVSRQRDALPFAQAWSSHFVADKFGAATTHWLKLIDRVRRGVGNPCPLLLIGMPASIVSFDPAARLDDTPPPAEGDNASIA
jgi:hypothetical protein